jgi:hypothetical protein
MRAIRARNINSNKKDLSPERREELLRALKARFERCIGKSSSKAQTAAYLLMILAMAERGGLKPRMVSGR